MLRESGSGKSSLGVSSRKLLLIPMAGLLRLWESAKEAWRFPTKGSRGYAPLIISLANTREVLYLVNRPGNVVSHEGCVPWIDRAIELLRPYAGEITLRGDTDFTLSAQLDRWDSQGIKFIFGMDAHPKVVKLAEALPQEAWKPLERLARYEIATEPRRKPQRIKEAMVRFKGYLKKKLVGESVAEFDYQPLKCGRSYRLVVVRKNISVQKGERVLFEDIKYFFYITNHTDYRAEQIVALANERCEQENVIEQLKNGVNAMRMPVDDLVSNWAYMVMSALAWNLKSWYGLLMPNRRRGLELVRMEFRRFLHAIVLLPAQIVRSGRKIIYRIMGYNRWLKDFLLPGKISVGWRLLEAGRWLMDGAYSWNVSNVPRRSYGFGRHESGPKTVMTNN